MNTTLEPNTSRASIPAPSDPPAPEEPGVSDIPQAHAGNTVRKSWPFNTDDVRRCTAIYGDAIQTLLVEAFLWCVDPEHAVLFQDFSAAVGFDSNTLYKVYTARYKHPTEDRHLPPSTAMCSGIRRFLRDARDRHQLETKEFLFLPTTKQILRGCDLALESHSPAIIFGPSHIGKTWALKYGALKKYAPNAFYARMPSLGGEPAMLRRLAAAVRVEPRPTMFETMTAITGALTRDSLLIVDEVHELALANNRPTYVKCLEVLREIIDASGCGAALAFTLIHDLTTAKSTTLQQLWRRAVHKIYLPVMPLKTDIEAILNNYQLKFPSERLKLSLPEVKEPFEPYQILRSVAKAEALKAVCERLRYGSELARKSQRKLRWEDFVWAHLAIAKNAEPEGEWDTK